MQKTKQGRLLDREIRTLVSRPPAARAAALSNFARRRTRFAVAAGLLAAAFIKPLGDLGWFAIHNELYSHILLIPFVSAYIIWMGRRNLVSNSVASPGWAVAPVAAGVSALAAYWVAVGAGWKPAEEDYLALMMFAFLALLAGLGFAFLGVRAMRQTAFPAAFLLFTIPFPVVVHDAIEAVSQYGSVEVAEALFKLAAMPVERQDLSVHLPGISMYVAPECSGIHSSLVLFITSMVAGYLFLRSPWKRTALALAVIPLGLIRNGFRVFVLGELCVNVNPKLIESAIHKQGGPYFFALSLIPFFALLYWLRRSERKNQKGEGRKSL